MPNDSDLPYLICTDLLSLIGRQLDQCAETSDPWESRYKFDALKPFVRTLRQQIETLTDPAELETCRQQMENIINKGKRISPDIPLICTQCGDVFPNTDEPDTSVCPDCRKTDTNSDSDSED